MNRNDPEQITRPPDGRSPEEQPKWRQDFPIDRPLDEYISRREFTKFLVLTSVGLVVGQFWIAAKSLFRREASPPDLDLGRIQDLPIGGSKTFAYPDQGTPCILVRLAEREVVAFDQRCTHLSCPVIPKVEDGLLHCPCHNGNFDLASGRPRSGPPRRPLPRIKLAIRGDRIFATGVEERTT